MRTSFPICPVWNHAELQLDELGFRLMSAKGSTFWGWNTIFLFWSTGWSSTSIEPQRCSIAKYVLFDESWRKRMRFVHPIPRGSIIKATNPRRLQALLSRHSIRALDYGACKALIGFLHLMCRLIASQAINTPVFLRIPDCGIVGKIWEIWEIA